MRDAVVICLALQNINTQPLAYNHCVMRHVVVQG